MYKLGIIGFGGIGTWHLNSIRDRKIPLEPYAVYDIDPEALSRAKDERLIAYETLESFLNDSNIDIVLVASPNDTHMQLCIDSMNHRKHCICEKPVALDLEQLDKMISASKANNVLFTVHQNRRWDKDYRIVKQAIQDKMIGEVYSIESKVHGSSGRIHGWRAFKECGGGMLYDWGVHLLDQFLDLRSNKIISIFASMRSIMNPDVDDVCTVHIRYDDQVDALLEISTVAFRSLPRWYVSGAKGTLVVEGWDCSGGITRLSSVADKVAPVIVTTEAGPTRTMAPQPPETKEEIELPKVETSWSDFYMNVIDVLDNKAELIVKPEQVRRVLAVIMACFESDRLGKSIQVDL